MSMKDLVKPISVYSLRILFGSILLLQVEAAETPTNAQTQPAAAVQPAPPPSAAPKKSAAELEKLVTSGKAAVAFSLVPTTIDDLIKIADAGGIMW